MRTKRAKISTFQGQKFATKCGNPFGFSQVNFARIHGFSQTDSREKHLARIYFINFMSMTGYVFFREEIMRFVKLAA